MELTYDPESDAVFIALKGHGIEILSASEHLGFKEKTPEIDIHNLKPVTV